MTNIRRSVRLLALTAVSAAMLAGLPNAANFGGLFGISAAQAREHSGGHHSAMGAAGHGISQGSQRNRAAAAPGGMDPHDVSQGSQRNRAAPAGVMQSGISQGSPRTTGN